MEGRTPRGLGCEYVKDVKGKLIGTGETFTLEADMIFKAIGQTFIDVNGGELALEGGRISVDAERRTSGARHLGGWRLRRRRQGPDRCRRR